MRNDTITVNDIIGMLPYMPRKELDRLQAALNALRGIVRQKDISSHFVGVEQTQDDDSWMLAALLRAAPTSGFSVAQLRQLDAYKSFAKKAPGLLAFVDGVTKEHAQRSWIMQFGWRILAADIRDMGLAAGGGTLLRHAHRIPSLIDARFPGYASMGQLHLIFRKRGANGR